MRTYQAVLIPLLLRSIYQVSRERNELIQDKQNTVPQFFYFFYFFYLTKFNDKHVCWVRAKLILMHKKKNHPSWYLLLHSSWKLQFNFVLIVLLIYPCKKLRWLIFQVWFSQMHLWLAVIWLLWVCQNQSVSLEEFPYLRFCLLNTACEHWQDNFPN